MTFNLNKINKIPQHEKIWLTIRGSFGSENVNGGPGELMTEGEYYLDCGNPCISYQEFPETGMGNTTTTIRLENEKLSLIRMGHVNSLMEFSTGKEYEGLLSTPYGELALQTYTRKMDVDYDEAKAPRKVQIEYDITIGNSMIESASKSNIIDIEIRHPKSKSI